jgi:hypothetical protein
MTDKNLSTAILRCAKQACMAYGRHKTHGRTIAGIERAESQVSALPAGCPLLGPKQACRRGGTHVSTPF